MGDEVDGMEKGLGDEVDGMEKGLGDEVEEECEQQCEYGGF